jgi:hypothetical protein
MSETVLQTRGVSSTVSFHERDHDRQHVGLLDCDEMGAMSAHQAAAQMDGFAAVYRSSPDSYHIWMLRPFESFDDAALWALKWRIADAEHIQQSMHRGCFVLRCRAKRRDDGSIYKSRPRLVAVDDSGDGPVSEAHYRLVETHGELDGAIVPSIKSERLVGDGSLSAHSYMTVTDSAKEEL